MKKQIDKEKLFMTCLIALLCIIFVGLFTYGLNSVLAMEGQFPPNVNTEALTDVPADKEEAVEYLNRVVKDAMDKKPKLDVNESFDIDTDSIETDGSAELKTTLLYCAEAFDTALEDDYEEIFTNYSEDMSKVLNIPEISADDVMDYTCDYIFYRCTSCGEESDEQKPDCEVCGSIYEYALRYRDEYTITLTIDPTDKNLDGDFNRRTKEEAVALVKENIQGWFEVEKLDIDYEEIKIVFKVNRTTDELKSLEYVKSMKVNSDVNTLGEISTLGKINVGFNITEKEGYYFTWPALTLSADEITLEPKGSDNLLATLTCTDPLKETVRWSSSDESIVTVDEEGYLDAGKEAGQAVITASFDFNGKTYTDECKVNVRVSVESSKLKKNDITLDVGQTKTLEVKISPNDASIKTVKWYTENEEIATVDENGVVRAISTGKTVVYSLTDDGYYKSSCEVTVK